MAATTSTGTLTYSQLKGVWLNASKGTRYHSNAWASLMAAIAEAESAGQPSVTNPTDNNGTQTSWGLWQISLGNHDAPSPNWSDPTENARLAIGKLDTQGLTAWGTYNSGAYKAYLSDKTAADLTSIPVGLSHVDTAAATAAAQATAACAWNINLLNFAPSILGFHPFGSFGNICVLSKSQVRALAAVGVMGAGVVIMGLGLAWIVKGSAIKIAADVLLPALTKLPGGGTSAPAWSKIPTSDAAGNPIPGS